MKIVPTDQPAAQILEFRNRSHPRCKPKCMHQRFVIDRHHGSVECADCGEVVSAFHALSSIAGEEGVFHRTWLRKREEIKEIDAYKPWLRAVRELESIWRGRYLPTCPHCHKPVEAEALLTTVQVPKPPKDRT